MSWVKGVFSLYLSIYGLRKGPGKLITGFLKVLEKSWIFSSERGEPCFLLFMFTTAMPWFAVVRKLESVMSFTHFRVLCNVPAWAVPHSQSWYGKGSSSLRSLLLPFSPLLFPSPVFPLSSVPHISRPSHSLFLQLQTCFRIANMRWQNVTQKRYGNCRSTCAADVF